MNNLNPYEILGIHKNFTLDELKDKYKRVAKKAHPDRGGSEELFTLVSLCYKKLHEEYKLKQIDKQFSDLKSSFQEFTTNQQSHQKQNTQLRKQHNQQYNQQQNQQQKQQHNQQHNQQYNQQHNQQHNQQQKQQQNQHKKKSKQNIHKHRHEKSYTGDFSEVFNKVFDDNKIQDPYDRGYGKLMLDRNDARPDIDIKKTVNSMKGFNNAFESQPTNKYNKKMIAYKEPEALPSSLKTLKYTELGVDKIKDFTTNINNLNACDYKIAHTTEKLIDHSMIKPRENFNDINDIQANRSNISYKMTDRDLQKEAMRKKRDKLKELKRLETQNKLDKLTAQNFENVNKLLLGFK